MVTKQATTTPIGNGPVSAKGRRTHAALVRAAREVFERDGFLGARITDIARGAGLAHGGFYHYFDSKEAIFREVAMQVVGEIFDASRTSGVGAFDPVAGIEEANRRFIDAWARNDRILAVLDQVATLNEDIMDLWRSIRRLFMERAQRGLERLQAEGKADPSLDARTAAAALAGMVENFVRVWRIHGEPFDRDVAVATLTRLWAQAIGLAVSTEGET